MKADPGRQWLLLDLQGLDTRLGQIAYRRAHLAEDAELAERVATADRLATELVTTRTAWEDLQREIAKAEADVLLVRQRADRDRARLESGTGSPKELQSLQHELVSLSRRQQELEDIELALMERAEALDQSITSLEQSRAEADAAVSAAAAARDAAVRLLDEEVSTIGRRREQLVDGVGPELLAVYEKIRAATGMGAAALRQRRCEGCRLELVGADIQRMAVAADDEVFRCEECRRILVRTPESGL